MRLDHLLSRETRWLRDTIVPEVESLNKAYGQPGKTGTTGSEELEGQKEGTIVPNRIKLVDKVHCIVLKARKGLQRTLKTAQRKDERQSKAYPNPYGNEACLQRLRRSKVPALTQTEMGEEEKVLERSSE